MSLKANAQIKGARAFFLSLLDLNMTNMPKEFNTKPIAPSMPPAMAETVVLVGSKCDVNSMLNRTQMKQTSPAANNFCLIIEHQGIWNSLNQFSSQYDKKH